MTELFHDTGRNLLVYRTPNPERIVQYVREAKQLDGSEYVAVPRTLYNTQLLRWLDLPVVPIMTDYDWPIERGRRPLLTQKLMSNFQVLHPKCFNLSDMGTMKTLATLWAADWLMLQFPPGECRALIVAPLSVLQRVWGDALFKNFLGRRTCKIVYGDAKRREKILAEPADFYIINFDGLAIGAHTTKRFELDGLSKTLFERNDIRIAIVDEASAYRESGTKRHRIARLIFGKRSYLWLLTGTPTPNGPTDAYGLAKLVNNAFGESKGSWKAKTMMQVATFKWLPRRDANQSVKRLLTPAIRIDIKDVWDGPAMTTQQRDVELTAEQKKHIAQLKRDVQIVIGVNKPITVPNEAAARQKLIQISLGAVYDGDHFAHTIDGAPRLAELEAVIESTERKLLIFVPLTSIVNLLYEHLKHKWACGVINGDTPKKERDRLIAAFLKEDEPRIIIADPATTAHGINEFVAADTVIWYGPTDKTELYLQGNKRAHRPGQNYPVTVVQLVSNPVEREIFRRLENNESLQGVFLDMVRKELI